jgi:low temperature requirement protein LtrA
LRAHRAFTLLELLPNLVFVVAIAQAASGLHHAIGETHAFKGAGSQPIAATG